jgi:hypothetical protein
MMMAYLMSYDDKAFQYLKEIATNSQLLGLINSSTPIEYLALKMTSTTWGQDKNTMGILGVLPAMVLCATLPGGRVNELIDLIIAYPDNDDYFFLGIKALTLATMTRQLARDVADKGSTSEPGYVVAFCDGEGTGIGLQLAATSSGLKYRMGCSGVWK